MICTGMISGAPSYPEFGDVCSKPIGESNNTGPDNTLPDRAVLAK